MFVINDDMSIYVTRGDIVFFTVRAYEDGKAHKFQPGDELRMKVYGKKDAETVVMQKRVFVESVYETVDEMNEDGDGITEEVGIYLDENDTKIGGVISKPVDYWYEVELISTDGSHQTIVGYDEDGPKLFRLMPEGRDLTDEEEGKPVIKPEDFSAVDSELSLGSSNPVQNQAVAREIENLKEWYGRTHDAVAKLHVTPQMFGAIADGVSDDTEALQAALDSGRTVVCSGDYAFARPLVIPSGCKFICYGEMHYTGNEYAIQLGCGNSTIFIKRLVSDGVGLRINKNRGDAYPWVAYNQVNIQEMECESNCLLMREDYTTGQNGVMYNTFMLSHWISNGADCVLVDNTAQSNNDNSVFFNENTFIGGLMAGKGADSYAVYLKSTKQTDLAGSVVSANKFICTSFEGSTNGVYLCNASENSFLDNRYEGNSVIIKLSGMSWDNTFKTNRGLGVTQISTEELTKINNDLHRNTFECVLRVGASARAAYRGYVFGANQWSVEPSKRIPVFLNNTTPSVVLEGYDGLTGIYQFAENRTHIIATAKDSRLQMSELYNNQQFEGFHVRLGAECTLTLLDSTGATVHTLTNSGTDTMYAHIRNYNGVWYRDN